jgi:hypothetical protein
MISCNAEKSGVFYVCMQRGSDADQNGCDASPGHVWHRRQKNQTGNPMMQWRYRTILFEFAKDGLLGDKYIDDEEVEKTLNELGGRSWELVNVSLLQEGLLAILKRPAEERAPIVSTAATAKEPVVSSPAYVPPVLSPRSEIPVADNPEGKQKSRDHHGQVRPDTGRREERDSVGGIRIS